VENAKAAQAKYKEANREKRTESAKLSQVRKKVLQTGIRNKVAFAKEVQEILKQGGQRKK
jgi:hypothetical protein